MINVLVTTTYTRSEGCSIDTILIPAANYYEASAIADKINTDNPWTKYANYGQYAIILGSHPPPESSV